MNISKIIFFPKSHTQSVDTLRLTKILADLELIKPTADTTNNYLPGEQFLTLLTFLGCSPNINLEPSEGENHCFISFIENTNETHCLGFTQTVNPKCPACKKRIANWKTELWKQPNSMCSCDKCQQTTPYAELNWKQECGFGRCGFEITHIYPHEAVPGDKLLNTLQKMSGFEWDYCYSNS